MSKCERQPGCCSEDHRQADAPSGDIEESMNDLTLASCCQREMEERERIEGYKQLLLQHDPTAARQDILRKAVLRDETQISPLLNENLSDDDSEVSSFEEDAEFLEVLRMKRMTEIREQLESKQRMEQSGYGLAQEIDANKLLGIVKEEVLSNTVCCIVHPSFSRKLDLLEFIGSIASRNRQDRYFVVTEEGGNRLSSVFGFADKSTVLLIFSDKALIGTVCLLDDDAWGEEHIEGSIQTCIQGKRHSPLKRSSSCSDEEELDPCDVCGRTYFHKHIT